MYLLDGIIKFSSSLTIVDLLFIIVILSLICLVIILLYKVNSNIEYERKQLESHNVVTNDLDLRSISQEIEAADKPVSIELTDYEKEQEEKAIISYDELLENTGSFKINYEEYNNGESFEEEGLSVKKVDMSNIASIDHEEPLNISKVPVISYAKEEAFLSALKQLQKMLN